MSSKERILARIREALREPAPRPGHHHAPSHGGAAASHPGDGFAQWLPAVGPDLEAWLDLFARNAADLKAEFHLLPDEAALPAALCQLAVENGWKQVATHRTSLTESALSAFPLPILHTDDGYGPEALEACDAGITGCDALIAQTGSVFVTAVSAGGRALSVLPPHHVVIARRQQLLPDLPAAYALLRERYGDTLPSFISFITGPSRTGDIERILVLGAHGPKRLTIFCV